MFLHVDVEGEKEATQQKKAILIKVSPLEDKVKQHTERIKEEVKQEKDTKEMLERNTKYLMEEEGEGMDNGEVLQSGIEIKQVEDTRMEILI